MSSITTTLKNAGKNLLAIARDPDALRRVVDMGQSITGHKTDPDHLNAIIAVISGAVAIGSALAAPAAP